MPVWQPPGRLPDQLGDAFAALYDWFEDNHFERANNEGWASAARSDPKMPELRRLVTASGWATPPALQDLLDGTSDTEALARAAYLARSCIDGGVAQYHPAASRPLSSLPPRQSLATQYDAHGWFDTDVADGYVLPKWGGGFRGRSFGAHFTNLVRARVARRQVRLTGRGARQSDGRGPSLPVHARRRDVPRLLRRGDAVL